MNDVLTNHFRSIKACVNLANLSEHLVIWDGKLPLAFGIELGELTLKYQKTEGIAARASSAALGYADDKDDAEEKLENLCFKVARALSNFFKKQGDLTRLAKVNYKIGYYQKLRDQLLINAARDLITIGTAAASEEGAALRGITPELIAQLQNAMFKFSSYDPAPRTGIVNRSTLLKELDALIAEMREDLEDLDDLVIQFDETEAGRRFIAGWQQARRIVDTGHRSDPDTETSPTPPSPA